MPAESGSSGGYAKQAGFWVGVRDSLLEENFGFPFVLVRAADGPGRGLAQLGLAEFRRRKGVSAARDEPRCAHELKKKMLEILKDVFDDEASAALSLFNRVRPPRPRSQ